MKFTKHRKTMYAFLTNNRGFTSWDFRNSFTVGYKGEWHKVKYDYLPRIIHELQRIKLPSGNNIEFTKMPINGTVAIRYKLDKSSYSQDDLDYMFNLKNIKLVKVLKKKNIFDKIKTFF